MPTDTNEAKDYTLDQKEATDDQVVVDTAFVPDEPVTADHVIEPTADQVVLSQLPDEYSRTEIADAASKLNAGGAPVDTVDVLLKQVNELTTRVDLYESQLNGVLARPLPDATADVKSLTERVRALENAHDKLLTANKDLAATVGENTDLHSRIRQFLDVHLAGKV